MPSNVTPKTALQTPETTESGAKQETIKLTTLPDDVLQFMFSFCTFKQLITLRQTTKIFNQLITKEMLFKSRISLYFNKETTQHLEELFNSQDEKNPTSYEKLLKLAFAKMCDGFSPREKQLLIIAKEGNLAMLKALEPPLFTDSFESLQLTDPKAQKIPFLRYLIEENHYTVLNYIFNEIIKPKFISEDKKLDVTHKKMGRTLLSWAVAFNQPTLVVANLVKNLVPTAISKDSYCPLPISYILRGAVNPNLPIKTTVPHIEEAIRIASTYSRLSLLKCLLPLLSFDLVNQVIKNPFMTTSRLETLKGDLLTNAIIGGSCETAQYVADLGASPNHNVGMAGSIFLPVYHNRLDLLKILCAQPGLILDTHDKSNRYRTPIQASKQHNHYAIYNYLYTYQAIIKTFTAKRATGLFDQKADPLEAIYKHKYWFISCSAAIISRSNKGEKRAENKQKNPDKNLKPGVERLKRFLITKLNPPTQPLTDKKEAQEDKHINMALGELKAELTKTGRSTLDKQLLDVVETLLKPAMKKREKPVSASVTSSKP